MAPGLQHFPKALDAKLFQYNEHKNIQIGDLHSSNVDDSAAPITSGFFNLEKGCNATTTFGFSEHKYVISGSCKISDQNGQTFFCKAGDSFYIPKGSTITFEAPEEDCKLYLVAQRAPNEARRSKPSKL